MRGLSVFNFLFVCFMASLGSLNAETAHNNLRPNPTNLTAVDGEMLGCDSPESTDPNSLPIWKTGDSLVLYGSVRYTLWQSAKCIYEIPQGASENTVNIESLAIQFRNSNCFQRGAKFQIWTYSSGERCSYRAGYLYVAQPDVDPTVIQWRYGVFSNDVTTARKTCPIPDVNQLQTHALDGTVGFFRHSENFRAYKYTFLQVGKKCRYEIVLKDPQNDNQPQVSVESLVKNVIHTATNCFQRDAEILVYTHPTHLGCPLVAPRKFIIAPGTGTSIAIISSRESNGQYTEWVEKY